MFDKQYGSAHIQLLLICVALMSCIDVKAQTLAHDIGLVEARKQVHSACPAEWQGMYSRITYEKIDVNGEMQFPDIWNGNASDKALYLSYAFNTLLPLSQGSETGLTVPLLSQDAAVISACWAEKGNMFTILERNANNNMGGELGFNVNIVRDDDSDGVFNMFNSCPQEVITCGVVDDQCSDTPVNEVADVAGPLRGCSISQKDTDSDGVNDLLDTCPDTPSDTETSDLDGEFIGCSISQKDTDGDGLKDNVDQCPESDLEFDVNFEGCAINQIDTDGDGVNDFDDEYPHQHANMCYP